MNVRHIAVAAALGLVIGLLASALLRDRSEVTGDSAVNQPATQVGTSVAIPAAPTAPPRAEEITSLRDALSFERDSRVALYEELDQVWEEIAELSAGVSALREPAAPNANSKTSANLPGKPDSRSQWIDVKALVAAGIPASDAERLREAYEAAQLDELYLRDQASREGWIGTGRFRSEMKTARHQLRADLGDEDYDWVLWASGRRNRVEIDDVLQNSAADDAGLQKGDLIVRYNGELMLTPRDLRRATLGGQLGDTVAIDALRAGQSIRFYVPAGPLGTRLGTSVHKPDS